MIRPDTSELCYNVYKYITASIELSVTNLADIHSLILFTPLES